MSNVHRPNHCSRIIATIQCVEKCDVFAENKVDFVKYCVEYDLLTASIRYHSCIFHSRIFSAPNSTRCKRC